MKPIVVIGAVLALLMVSFAPPGGTAHCSLRSLAPDTPIGAGVDVGTSTCEQSVTIRFHYSHFSANVVTVPAGAKVTFTLRNDDPIDHEWIVGTPDVHERHRHGTEAFHGRIPTEVSVPAYSTRVTTVTFDTPGEYAFICHLPGHEEYGMSGTVIVR